MHTEGTVVGNGWMGEAFFSELFAELFTRVAGGVVLADLGSVVW